MFLGCNKIGAHKIRGQTQIYQVPKIDPTSMNLQRQVLDYILNGMLFIASLVIFSWVE